MDNTRGRGSYKAYLRNNAAVPYSTLRYRQQRTQVSRIPQPAFEVSIMIIKWLKFPIFQNFLNLLWTL